MPGEGAAFGIKFASRNHPTESLVHLRVDSFNRDYPSVHFGDDRTTLQHDVSTVPWNPLPEFGFLRVERATCFRSATTAVKNTQVRSALTRRRHRVHLVLQIHRRIVVQNSSATLTRQQLLSLLQILKILRPHGDLA